MLTAILRSGHRHSPDRGRHSESILWLTGFVALAIAWTWPLVLHFTSRIPHDPGDSLLNIWLIWWNAHAIPFTSRWWNPPIFFPMTGALALSEHLAGLAPLTTPLQWAGATPLTAYNAAFVLSFALSGFFAFLLGRQLAEAEGASPAAGRLAGMVAGLVYGFGPYRAGQLAHLQVLTSEWMPLALVAMHAYLADGRQRWLVLLSVAWLVQALSNGYYLFFFPVLVTAWLLWFVDWRRQPLRGAALLGTFAAASLPLAGMLKTYAAVQQRLGLGRTTGDMVNFSATLAAFVQAPGLLRFWPTTATATTEAFLFPGVTGLLLLAGAWMLWSRRRVTPLPARPALLFYALAAALMSALALGPRSAGSAAVLHPYALFAWLPGFAALRVPARFAMLATLCLSAAAAIAAARLAPRRQGAFIVFGALVTAGTMVDGWMRPLPLALPPGRVELPDLRGAAVIELPLGDAAIDTAAMYRAMFHRRPLINGYSGHTPPHYAILSIALRRGDPSALAGLARGRPLVVLVNGARDRDDKIRRLVQGLPGIEPLGNSAGGLIHVLPAGASLRQPVPGPRWPDRRRQTARFEIELDLGTPRTVRTVAFPLRWRFRELDARIRIQGSTDGTTWTTVWEDWTGGPAVAAALEDPLEAPVRLTIPDLEMRYLRVYPAEGWLQREIAVYGPR